MIFQNTYKTHGSFLFRELHLRFCTCLRAYLNRSGTNLLSDLGGELGDDHTLAVNLNLSRQRTGLAVRGRGGAGVLGVNIAINKKCGMSKTAVLWHG